MTTRTRRHHGGAHARLRRSVTARAACRDEGFSSLELVILTPVLLAMLLLVVGFGRVTHGRQMVQQAAAAAARAATLDSSPIQARIDARSEAHAVLDQAGVSCQSFNAYVDTSEFQPGGQVSVTVTCTANLSDLVSVGFPGSKTLTASATSPIEQFRQIGVG